jgi:hypothetical protein
LKFALFCSKIRPPSTSPGRKLRLGCFHSTLHSPGYPFLKIGPTGQLHLHGVYQQHVMESGQTAFPFLETQHGQVRVDTRKTRIISQQGIYLVPTLPHGSSDANINPSY